MPQAVITVAGIAPPGQGKKQGKVTDTAGGVWNVWHDKLQNFRMGVTYNITYEEGEFNGHKFYLIKTSDPAGQQNPAQQAPTRSPAAPAFPTPKDEMIFVCGALNHAFSNPTINPMQLQVTEVAAFVSLLRQVWRGTLGAPKPQMQPPQGQQMDDEIPF